MTKDEALKLALEALEEVKSWKSPTRWDGCFDKEITAIKEALAQPEQEPVTWAGVDFDIKTTPPQRTWVGLTDEERNHARQTVTYSQLAMTASEWAEKVQIETERRLKEKNT